MILSCRMQARIIGGGGGGGGGALFVPPSPSLCDHVKKIEVKNKEINSEQCEIEVVRIPGIRYSANNPPYPRFGFS